MGQFRNQDNTRKQGNNKDTSSKAMLAIDGVGFDWSDMAEEQVQADMALLITFALTIPQLTVHDNGLRYGLSLLLFDHEFDLV
ncbi:hypothetical protein Tco_1190127 [Tanacetum coccineum]